MSKQHEAAMSMVDPICLEAPLWPRACHELVAVKQLAASAAAFAAVRHGGTVAACQAGSS